MRNHERSCIGCIHNDGVAVVVVGDEPCWTCLHSTVDLPNYEEELPQKRLVTNADRIRSMTDEELAKIMTDDFCELLCGSPISCDGDCEKKMLRWLKQEVDHDKR